MSHNPISRVVLLVLGFRLDTPQIAERAHPYFGDILDPSGPAEHNMARCQQSTGSDEVAGSGKFPSPIVEQFDLNKAIVLNSHG